MRVLLDTHALIWWWTDSLRLSSTVRQVIADPANEIFISTASVWEIRTKQRLGKLSQIPDLTAHFSELLQRLDAIPEGEGTLTGDLGKGLRGVGLMIGKSGVPVIPVRLFGAYEALPRGKSLPRPSKITLVVGEPIVFTKEELAAKDKDAYTALSQRVMDEIGKLEIKVPA